jgi:hypothetical protein
MTGDEEPDDGLVGAFEVDVLHPVADDPGLHAVVERHDDLRLPPDLGMDGMFDSHGDRPLGLADIRFAAKHYYDTEFRFSPERSNAALPVWSDQNPLAALYSVLFGEYGDHATGVRLKNAFRALESAEHKIVDRVPIELLGQVTPVRFTGDQLTPPLDVRDGDGVVLGDPDNAADLAGFWNLRSLGLRIVFWPTSGPDALETYCLGSISEGASRAGERWDPYVWSREPWGDPERAPKIPGPLEELYTELGAKPLRATLSASTWVQPGHRPGAWSSLSRSVLGSVEDRWSRLSIVFELPPSPYPATPVERSWDAHWMTTISTYGEHAFPDHTVRLPKLPELNGWASEQMSPIRHVRAEGGGIAAFTRVGDTSVDLHLVEKVEVVQQVFRRAGLETEISPAGEAVSRIIRQMDGLWGCRRFRLPGVRKLLASSKVHKGKDLIGQIEDDGSYSHYKNVGTAAETFQVLLEKGVFRVGLRIRCPACRIHSRHQPETLASEVKCPRCGSEFLLAVCIENADWEYEPSGFFAHHREHGAIPVILTMLRLEHDVEESALFLAPSHTISGPGVECESDLLALSQGHRGEIALVIGECKGGEQEIEAADVANLTKIADHVRRSGIECYIVFATTRGRFTNTELTEFRAYRDRAMQESSLHDRMRGRPRPAPILLAWSQLQSFNAFPYSVGDLLPEKYMSDLGDLAADTSFAHLDPNDLEARAAAEDEELLI